MSTTESTKPLRPAFCQRADCPADAGKPYCSRCGADISSYVTAITAAREPIGVTPDGTIVSAPGASAVDAPSIRVHRVTPAAQAPSSMRRSRRCAGATG